MNEKATKENNQIYDRMWI